MLAAAVRTGGRRALASTAPSREVTACTHEAIRDILSRASLDAEPRSVALYQSAFDRNTPGCERLEFVGDSVIGAVVSKHVMEAFPGDGPGPLTIAKSRLVRTDMLAQFARHLKLGEHIRAPELPGWKHPKSASPPADCSFAPPAGHNAVRTHPSSHSNNSHSNKTLEDVFEAFVGAVYLDQPHPNCTKGVASRDSLWAPTALVLGVVLEVAGPASNYQGSKLSSTQAVDYKGLLQEVGVWVVGGRGGRLSTVLGVQ
jgi:hypothetical protein